MSLTVLSKNFLTIKKADAIKIKLCIHIPRYVWQIEIMLRSSQIDILHQMFESIVKSG